MGDRRADDGRGAVVIDHLTIALSGRPAPKGSLRHVGKGRMIEQVAGSKPWRYAVTLAARQAVARDQWTPPEGPVEVTAHVLIPHLKTRRDWPVTRSSGDIDKHARNILDALVDGGALRDDSQVVRLVVSKTYSHTPGALIIVRAVEELTP